ncbi:MULTISPECIES: aldolase [unclassified Enterobacter]|uniref:3-oxo-tetronate 4-phosphate decarboxylase n=1 Tax=unclassified Enterobacter TaxID=2608935 RepID=UPI0008EA1319|nr:MULTISPECIES: aldolase [unclassified Enterobacter]SFR05996.1 Ribulose-5-phosphate 4-epimerase/Fuculose-1-phosphate aldolase [Enterobacter sp. kpr-6]
MSGITEYQLREQLVHYGASLFNRGYSSGGSGNISVRLPDGGYLVTPTNSCLGELKPETLSRLDADGLHIDGEKPSKEVPMHMAWYRHRPSCGAVVHLHSPWLTALSCLPCETPANCLPPLTPYYVMRVGQLPLLPYFRPGHDNIAHALAEIAPDRTAALLANHGPVVSGKTLREAVFNMEELEDSARIWLTLKPLGYVPLTAEAIAELQQVYRP